MIYEIIKYCISPDLSYRMIRLFCQYHCIICSVIFLHLLNFYVDRMFELYDLLDNLRNFCGYALVIVHLMVQLNSVLSN